MIEMINNQSSEHTTIAQPNTAFGRIQYIDVAKGIAILAVIVGHVSIRLSSMSKGASLITALCFTFHMPLFFFLSGYFLHCEKPMNCKREARRLVLPYACIAALIVLLQILTTHMLGDYPIGMSRGTFALGWLDAALYGSASISGKELWPQQFRIGAIWFLLALFWARLLVKISYRFSHTAIVIVGFVIAGIISARYVWLPLSIQAGLSATSYVYLGTVVRNHNMLNKYILNWKIFTVSIAVWVFAILRFNGFGMGLADFGSSPADVLRNFVGSIAASYVVLCVSAFMERHFRYIPKVLARIGRLSILILAVHIVDDDVTRIESINNAILGTGVGAFWLVIIESAIRCTYSVFIALCLEKIRSVRAIFF